MKRSRDDVAVGAQKKKKVEEESIEDDSEEMSDMIDSQSDGDGAESLSNQLSETVNTEFMPTFKRNLGTLPIFLNVSFF